MQKIRIDFDNPGLPQHISAVENDSQSRFFQATLYENGKAYTAPEGATYSIMYHGFGPQNQGWYDTINDGAGKRAACAVSGNVVTCEIARQALQVPGHVSIVLCVTTGKGYMLKSWPIECDCKNDRYDSTAEIQSFFYITQVSNADWTQAIQAWENLKDAIDPTLSVSGKAADAAKVGEAVGQLKEDKIDKPSISDNGKISRAKDGGVEWVDVGQPTDEQTNNAVASWLNEHPEATTTVQDGSIDEIKINKNFLPYIKKDYVTPEMFNAKADGVTDDTEAIQKALNSGKQVLFVSVYLSKRLTIPSGCRIYGTNGSKIIFDDTVGFILSGMSIIIDGLSITCNLSRTEQTVAITDNGNRAARSTFKNLKILSWYAGLDLSKGYNDNVIIDNIAFNTVNCCINLKHGDCSIIRNVTAEPFIDYLVFLNQCNAITINNVLATGVRDTYQNNNSVVFIFIGTPNADKRLGVNILVSSVFCERINTICKSTASFLHINNVYCNENYPLTNAFHFQKSNGMTQNACIILQNINCSNYTGIGVFSSISAVSEKIGNISFDGKGNMPVVEILDSDDLSYSEKSNLNTPISKSVLKQKISKTKNVYFDFEGNLSSPPGREDFLIGDVKLRSFFTSDIHAFRNLIGEVYTYKNSSENQWAPIQLGLPTFNKYMLRDNLKGSFPGQLVFNETSNCLAFWNGSAWQNISSETVS